MNISRDRTITIEIFTDRFPTYATPMLSIVDRHIKGYGDVDEIVLYHSPNQKETIYNWEFPDEFKRLLNELYKDLWLQVKRTVDYRSIVPIGSENEDYNKRMQSRYNEIKKVHDKQAQKLEQFIFELEKLPQKR
jgi:hypothetical protein